MTTQTGQSEIFLRQILCENLKNCKVGLKIADMHLVVIEKMGLSGILRTGKLVCELSFCPVTFVENSRCCVTHVSLEKPEGVD